MKFKKLQVLALVLFFLNCQFLGAQGFQRLYDVQNLITTNGVLAARPTPDGGYLFVASQPDQMVKTDPEGEILWTKIDSVPTSDDPVSDLFVLPNGNYAHGVYIENGSHPNTISILNQQGNVLEQRVFYGFSKFHPVDDGFYVVNRISDTTLQTYRLDAALNTVWSVPVQFEKLGFIFDLVTTNDGGFAVLLSSDSIPNGGLTSRLLKLDDSGNKEWETILPNLISFNAWFGSLSQAPSGDYFVTTTNGVFSNLCRVSNTGTLLWNENLDKLIWSHCLTADGDIALCGATSNLEDLFLQKRDSDGNEIFSKVIKPNGYDGVAYHICTTPDNGLLLGGLLWAPDQSEYALLMKTDAAGNVFPNFIQGNAFFDKNHDCMPNNPDLPLEEWLLTLEGDNFESVARTDASGFYQFNVPPGDYTVSVHRPGALWTACSDEYSLTIGSQPDTLLQDFFLQDSALCSLLDVSIATPFLRRCFNNIYQVAWCNQGTIAANDVMIEVILPPQLDFISSTLAPASQSGDTLRFELGTVGFAECGDFRIVVNVNCDSTIAGQTLCTTARIFPDTLCILPANWSGARVIADVKCLGDTTVEFSLKNIGTAPSSTLDYIITEDHVVLYNGSFDLPVGQQMLIHRPATGFTQRIEAEQEPGYPFGSLPSAAIEGCGGWNSTGLINQYALDDADPFTDIDCREVIASYDPNDKQAFPAGYSDEHFVEPETPISYLIRFQNTGTDTAFTVEIRDTLSNWLDPATLRVGAASHPFTWNIRDSGALSFRFEHILLPDSNVNEAASHGFIQFRIQPRTDAPLGTLIENTAAIYFDFNAPVLTNTTWHTLGRDFYTVSLFDIPENSGLPVLVKPNPFRTNFQLVLPDEATGAFKFSLYNATGMLVLENPFRGPVLEQNLPQLQEGMYWFDLRDETGKVVARGKILRQAY